MPSFGLIAAAMGLILWLALQRIIAGNAYLLWLVAWSITTFVFYGVDKAQAQRRWWRVPEAVLHLLSLIGGVIGGWAGMLFFRHKTQKPEFRLVLIIASIMQVAVALIILR